MPGRAARRRLRGGAHRPPGSCARQRRQLVAGSGRYLPAHAGPQRRPPYHAARAHAGGAGRGAGPVPAGRPCRPSGALHGEHAHAI
ncbi:hypothetical protein G6F65_021056 [Rhizopus arrhizus]|nr:hypothetical protein G6F65_021056 [Rhizopus arrhizus]